MHAALSPRLCPLLQPTSPIPWGMPLFQGASGTPPSHTPNQGYFALSHLCLILLSHSQLTPRSPPGQEPLPAHIPPTVPRPAHPAELPVPSLGYLEYLSLLPPLSLSTSLFSLDDCPPSNSAPGFHSCPPPLHSTRQL